MRPTQFQNKLWNTLSIDDKKRIKKEYIQAVSDHETFYDDIWLEGCSYGIMTTLEQLFGKDNILNFKI